jgi:hypothetical protein
MGVSWILDIAKDQGLVQSVLQHPFHNKMTYFTISGSYWFNRDQFKQMNRRKRAPSSDILLEKLKPSTGSGELDLNQLGVENLVFSETNSDWMIFVGQDKGCEKFATGCFTSAVVSYDHGGSWTKLDTWVQRWFVFSI